MTKRTRAQLASEATNTNIPDNSTQQITPGKVRTQYTDERDSTINYIDDLNGSTENDFILVDTDGESIKTTRDYPQRLDIDTDNNESFISFKKSGVFKSSIGHSTIGTDIFRIVQSANANLLIEGPGNTSIQLISDGRVFINGDSANIEIDPDTGGNIVLKNVPTSSAGLPSGAIWNDSGTLKIV
jgi:hypothetical protein